MLCWNCGAFTEMLSLQQLHMETLLYYWGLLTSFCYYVENIENSFDQLFYIM